MGTTRWLFGDQLGDDFLDDEDQRLARFRHQRASPWAPPWGRTTA